MKRFFVAALLVLSFGASGTKADSKSGSIDNPKQIPDSIVISANRFPTSIEKTASSVTIISEEDINKSQTVMVSELLKQVPGLDVVRLGGAGTQTSVFMRGTNSNHTLVIIDGIEMNNPTTSSFDFAFLNVSNIQRIEVLRGPQSVLYGADAVGGVIQIFTKRGFGKLKTEISAEAGSFNSYTESIHMSGSENIIDYSLFVSRKDSDGFSTIREDAGGEEKDGFESTDIVANIGLQITDNYELSFVGKLIDANADIDKSSAVYDDPNSYSENKMNSIALRLKNLDTDSKMFKPELSVAFSSQDLKSVDLLDDAHGASSSELNSTGKRFKLSASNQMEVIENIHTVIGFDYEKETYESDINSTSFFGPYSDTTEELSASTVSIYGLDDWAITEQFSVSGGLRFDDHEDFGSKVTYRFTSLYKFASQGLTLKGTYGSAFKAPSLYQINNETYGNPDLIPEENIGWEIGFTKTSLDNILNFGATYFYNEIDNLIGFDALFKSININEVSTKGVEAFAQIRFKNSSVRFDFTYTDIENKSDESKIIRRPEEKIRMHINHQFSKAIHATLSIQSIGDRFDTDFKPWPGPNEDIILDAYTVVNISASYQILENTVVTGRVDNLFDEDYQDVLRYNTPDRSGYLGLKISL